MIIKNKIFKKTLIHTIFLIFLLASTTSKSNEALDIFQEAINSEDRKHFIELTREGFISRRDQIKENLIQGIENLRPTLPQQVADGVFLISVMNTGDGIYYHFTVADEYKNFDWYSYQISIACYNAPTMMTLLAGFKYYYTYEYSNRANNKNFFISEENCP